MTDSTYGGVDRVGKDRHSYYRKVVGHHENVSLPVNGETLINILCNRLLDLNRLATDGNIVNLLRGMTITELRQAVDLGDVTEWHNERILKEGEQ